MNKPDGNPETRAALFQRVGICYGVNDLQRFSRRG